MTNLRFLILLNQKYLVGFDDDKGRRKISWLPPRQDQTETCNSSSVPCSSLWVISKIFGWVKDHPHPPRQDQWQPVILPLCLVALLPVKARTWRAKSITSSIALQSRYICFTNKLKRYAEKIYVQNFQLIYLC